MSVQTTAVIASLSNKIPGWLKLSVEEWVPVLTCLNYLGGWTSSLLSSRNNEFQMHEIAKERDSAIKVYELAQQSYLNNSLGLAMKYINDAIDEFKTPLKNLKEVKFDKTMFAEMVFFKARILYAQNKYDEAICCIDHINLIDQDNKNKQTNGLLNNNLLALNLLAFLYIYHKNDYRKAAIYLRESIKLNDTQVFARFYLGFINADKKLMSEAIDCLQKTCLHLVQPDRKTDTVEIRNLHASIIEDFIPYIVSEWLSVNTKNENNPRILSQIASACAGILSQLSSTLPKSCAIKISENRINALMRIAKIKSMGSRFEQYDLDWRDAFGLPSTINTFFCVYPSSCVDHAVTQLFPYGTDTSYLKTDDFKKSMSLLIMEWAKMGWLTEIANSNPKFKALCQLVKQSKHKLNKEESETDIKIICSKSDIISEFVDYYVTEKSWSPWFKVVKNNTNEPMFTSLIHIACFVQGIELKVYQHEKDKLVLLSSQKPFKAALNCKTDAPKELHVLFNEDSDEFTLLHELNTPSRVYYWLALNGCWELLKKDPNNKTAWDILSKRSYAALPLIANESLFENNSNYSKEFIFGQLKNMIKQPTFREKVEAQFILLLSYYKLTIPENKIDEVVILNNEIIASKQQPYAELARVMRLLLYRNSNYVPNKETWNADLELFKNDDLNFSVSKNLRQLILAEVYLRDLYTDTCLGADEKLINSLLISYLEANKLINDDNAKNSTEIFCAKFLSERSKPILSFMHSFAASLLVEISKTSGDKNNYSDVCHKMKFEIPVYKTSNANFKAIVEELNSHIFQIMFKDEFSSDMTCSS